MSIVRALALVFVVLVGSTPSVHAGEPIEEARAFFARYVRSYHAFDPAVAELYADDAAITNRRTYPDGRVRVLSLTGTQYKTLLRQTMPLARSRGDVSRYEGAKYAVEPGGVRIHLTRHSELKKYSSPLSLLVGPGKDGRWVVLEERSESVP